MAIAPTPQGNAPAAAGSPGAGSTRDRAAAAAQRELDEAHCAALRAAQQAREDDRRKAMHAVAGDLLRVFPTHC